MRWILGSSLRFGRLVVGAAVALLVLGIVQMRAAPVEVYPEFMPPTVQIQTEALGLSAAEVEQLVTLGLEQNLLNGLPWLDHIHSRSEPGLSVVDLVFRPGTDVYAARQMVQERLTQAHALPAVGSGPTMIQPLASVNRVAMIGLSSHSVPLIDMSVLARWRIRPQLMAVPGVANVSIYGQRDRQLQVQVDPARLARSRVTLTQIIDTTGNALWSSPLTFVEASTPGTGGFVESPNQRLAIQNVLPISTPKQLAAVPVADAPGIRLGDVADVIEDHQPLIGDAIVGGAPGLFLVIDKFPEANTLQVTRAVEKAMAEMQPGLTGITVDSSVYRPATFIESALHTVGLAALVGFLLLLALLLATFASWRAALIGAVAVPLSLLAAAYVLYLRGGTFTTMTLVGLTAALAVVIDDAVGDVDAIRRRIRERRAAGDTGPITASVIESCRRVRGTMVFATLIILLAAVPFLALGSLTTAFTRPLVLTYALALLASMAVALTLTPTLAVLLPGGASEPAGPSPFARWVHRGFDRRLAGSIRRRDGVLAIAGVLAVATLTAIPQLAAGHTAGLLPTMQDRNLLMHVQAAPGTSLPEMDRITTAIGRELRGVAGVRDVGVHVGRAVSSDQITDVNTAEVWISVAEDANYARTQAAIRAVAGGYPGIATNLVTYPNDRVAAVAAGQSQGLVVRVYGQDLSTLQATADQIRKMISAVPGVVAPHVLPLVEEPTAQVKVDPIKAQQHGLKPGDVRRSVTTLTSGLVAGNLYEQAKIFDVVVVGTPAARASLTSLQDLRLDTPNGGQVRLGDVASVSIGPQPTVITHDEVSRSADVVFSVWGRSAAAVAADVRTRVAALPMPQEYHVQVLGNATVAQQDTRRALAYGAAALVAILLLLQAATASWRRAVVLLAVLPLACAGGVLAAPLAGGIWSVGALSGLFAVFALAVRGCLSLVQRIRTLEAAQAADQNVEPGEARPGATREQAVLAAARERVVPVLQTALATAAVLAPVLVLGGRPGLEILRPLAVTALGGLISSTVVTALLLPALFLAITPRPRPISREPEPITLATPV